MKKVLITGAGSYIGSSFERWMKQWEDKYLVDTMDMINVDLDKASFSGYDVIFHVAGIAHRKETNENKDLYYKVNRDLAIETAKKAKREGVAQFIILSTMSVYGLTTGTINKDTVENPKNHYGKSKYEADCVIKELNDEFFKVAIIRPPMVYGKGCKGNYQTLRKFALKSCVFPSIKNQRSMIYIDNLTEFVRYIIDNGKTGVYFPQNLQYVCTSDMVKKIAEYNVHRIKMIGVFNFIIKNVHIAIIEKVFGSLTYDMCDSVSMIESNKIVDFDTSIRNTEI